MSTLMSKTNLIPQLTDSKHVDIFALFYLNKSHVCLWEINLNNIQT